VRVIAGIYKGLPIQAPKGNSTRPTSDRTREALFSILGDLEDKRVLDLFAGSGALGLEARSRGATHVTLIDNSVSAIAAIKANAKRLDADVEVVRAEVGRWLSRAQTARAHYDLILLDPPYRQAASWAGRLTEALPPLLAPGGRIVTESDRRDPMDLALPMTDERRYGDTLIRIHRA
jgi:16S rRNA (guanine966-N2)-methyltransferase